MTHRDAVRRTVRALGALGLCASAAGVLVGCHGALVPVMILAPTSPVLVEVGLSNPHGPTVTLVNEADVPVDIRLWVGRIDYREASGFRDQRTGIAMVATVPPGEFRKVNGGQADWPTGQSDGVVWMRLVAEGSISWFEFERPGPYRVVMRRVDSEWFAPGPIEFIATSGQVMTPLPESAWIEHRDGDFPVSAPPAPVIQDLGDDPSAG